ncbi:MAG: SDR family oxidoreductase, partial [Planctomycetia bacterium]|nr:SDR family oxidoreductase [Planctomycetia bacterium]
LFVSCQSAARALRITIRVVTLCRSILKRKRRPPAKARKKPVNEQALAEVLLDLRGAWTRGGGVRPVIHVVSNASAVRLLGKPNGRRLLEKPLVPDTIAYCGAAAATLPAGADADDVVEDFAKRFGELPRVVLLPGVGYAALASGRAQIEAIQPVYDAHVAMVEGTLAFGGPRPLSPRANRYIAEWEVERYRRSLVVGSAAEQALLNRVAVVTGGGGCIGRAIALAVARAGGQVAILDIVRADAEETARKVEEAAGAGRALPLVCDVTSEPAVADALRKTVLAFGGVDILVAAAAIAPSYPLLDFPLSAWQKTLDINLTGYFLIGREAARVMARQDIGGCMVLISSKTALSASKSHSAYNATKGGEVHMMRGWALELGQYGIRVNSVAPGNVFRGSKLWSPEYFRACAKKRGIKVEEVIPYYTSLSALNLEIEADDIAGVVAFLAGDAGRKISGQTIVCDAGQVFVR